MKELTKEIIEDYQQPERAISNYIRDVATELSGLENLAEDFDSLGKVCEIIEDTIHHFKEGVLSE